MNKSGAIVICFNIRRYFVAYQCQYCEGAPEGFLVRKTGWIFALDGRSPMEHIELPKYIPENEAGRRRQTSLIRGVFCTLCTH
jgi:hypothetical protein